MKFVRLLIAIGCLAEVPLSVAQAAHLYPQPAGEARNAAGYAVTVDGQPTGVAAVRNSAMPVNTRWPGHQRELDQTEVDGMVRFSTVGKTTVAVTASRDFKEVKVRPSAKGVKPTVAGRTATFTIPGPGFYSVEFDGPHENLHVFADPPETMKAKTGEPGVRYFGPGEHDAGLITLKTGESLYIDEGAVVYGRVEARDADHIRILGRGILDMSRIKEQPKPIDPKLAEEQRKKGFAITNVKRWNAVKLAFCDDVLIDGITIRDSLLYNIRPIGCRNLTIRNVKICGNWRYNADGIDMHNCENVRVSDCFVRTFDDSICVKGFDYTMDEGEMLHDGYRHNVFTNIVVEDCTVWCDWGRCLEFGAETRAEAIRDVTWRDCDILHVHSAPLEIQNCDYADIHDVLFENIRLELDHPQAKTSYSATAKSFDPKAREGQPPVFSSVVHVIAEYSKGDKRRGRNRDIRLKDIHVTGPQMPRFMSRGYDAEHRSAGITVDGIYWNGREVSAEAAKGQGVGPFADPIRFVRVPTADGVCRGTVDATQAGITTGTVPAAGRVKPTGWLRDTMCAARDGYTACMDDVDEQFRKAWAATTQPRGKDVHWWANPGSWSAEGGAYWFDGLVKMAFQLDDPALRAMASNRLETVLTKTNPDSWGFLWWMRRDNPEDVQALKGDAFLLANSEKLVDTIGAWYEATGDIRAKRALVTAFTGAAFELYKPVRGAYEAWRLTGDSAIARLLDEQLFERAEGANGVTNLTCAKMGGRYGKEPPKYLEETLWIKYRHEQMFKLPTRHGLGASWGVFQALRRYQWTGDADMLKTVRAWCAFLDTNCRLPFGAWVMDEEWGYPGPTRATETCTVACENALRLALLAVLGEGTWADDLEESVYNVGPNCTTADFGLHTYMQQPNRVKACDLSDCSHGGDGLDSAGWKEHGRYARKHAPLCCTAGLNRIWPDFVQGMWLETRTGGVAAALYGPCAFETRLGGERFAVREMTAYPFEDTIRFLVDAAPVQSFSFSVRIPRWCDEYEVAVNGHPVDSAPVNGFIRLMRVWRPGDTVTVKLPMKPRYATMTDRNPCARGEAPRTYGWLKVGPLLFAHPLPMRDVNTPLEPDAIPPAILPADAAHAEIVCTRPPSAWGGENPGAAGRPFRWDESARAPLKLRVRAADGRRLELVPYGTAKFRISMFPVL